jgi:hypothetical protein
MSKAGRCRNAFVRRPSQGTGQRAGLPEDRTWRDQGDVMPARGQYRVHRAKGRRVEYDETSRHEHGGYIESAKNLERQLADGLERTRLRLEQQREELRCLAAARRAADSAAKN